jgi:hypothetical protein
LLLSFCFILIAISLTPILSSLHHLIHLCWLILVLYFSSCLFPQVKVFTLLSSKCFQFISIVDLSFSNNANSWYQICFVIITDL